VKAIFQVVRSSGSTSGKVFVFHGRHTPPDLFLETNQMPPELFTETRICLRDGSPRFLNRDLRHDPLSQSISGAVI
jgi:hypothetical protein